MNRAKLVRSGNTVAIEIPEDLAAELGLVEGDDVAFD
jgi:antitoxin component of MazEF toxin-antitoxin module